MDLFKEFCNICYTKGSQSPIKNIGVEDGGYKKQILITLFGNTSTLNSYDIYLCVNCCEYLENFDKFRETCFKNFILFRQLFFDMKSQLECIKDENAESKLKQFLIEKVFNGHDEEINKKYFDVKETDKTEKTNNTETVEETGIKEEECLTQDVKNEYPTHSEVDINSDDEFHSDLDSEEDDDMEIKIEPKVECKQETPENSMQIEISVVENHDENLNSEEDADIEDSEEDVNESDMEMDEFIYSELPTETSQTTHETENDENVTNYELGESTSVGSSSESMVVNVATNSSSRSSQKSEPNKLKYDTFEGPPCPLDLRFKCKKCDKVLQSNSHLIDHQRIHTGDRPFKCDICQKTFNIQSNLTVHKRIHTGIRPYKCKECDKSFIQLCSLNIHARVHSGIKPFKCTKCEKAYRTSSSLRKHKFAHHKN